MPDFASFSLLTNVLWFALAASIVWFAGTKLTKYADHIAAQTGIGEALMGVFLLAGVTSLPEIATSFTAAQSGNADLGVNNLLGSIALQVAILALADAVYGEGALTAVIPDPVVMLQGALNICLLTFVAIAILIGDIALFGAGAWSWLLLAASLASFKKLAQARGRKPWIANIDIDREDESRATASKEGRAGYLALKTGLSALAILIAGFIVASSGEAIATQSGLGSSFMGVAFVALATSLPEVSTVFAAMRRRLYTMAISDILGTNIINITLLFGVDAIAEGDPIFNTVGTFSALSALLGIVLTSLFLIGLAERRDKTIWRIGTDSALVLTAYISGIIFLYAL